MALAGTALIDVKGDWDGFARDVNRNMAGSRFGSVFGGLGRAAGAAFLGGTAAAIGGGGALFAIGSSFDSAFDTIRIGTGATGDALAALQDDFRAVARDIPADFGQVSTAVADLNTRLGLTGEPLQDLAGQFLNLSRITNTDVASNIEALTRVFGDWGVAVTDQPDALDAIFRASQATGAGIDQLGRQVVQFGAPLRQMGFGFEESLALLGKFEKEGVNTELVMGSLRIALGQFARDGEAAPDALARLSQEIRDLEDPTAATGLAMEVFGARAGPDMAAAIREGRFELGDLYDAVAAGEETIQTAADDTDSFGEAWTRFKNNVLLALEPIATRVFEGMGRLMEDLIPVVEDVVGWFEGLATVFEEEGFTGVLGVLASQLDTAWDDHIYPAIVGLGESIQTWFEDLWTDYIKPGVETAWDDFQLWIENDGPDRLIESFRIALDAFLVEWEEDFRRGLSIIWQSIVDYWNGLEFGKLGSKAGLELVGAVLEALALLATIGWRVLMWIVAAFDAVWDALFNLGKAIGARIAGGIMDAIKGALTGRGWLDGVLRLVTPGRNLLDLWPGRAAGGPVTAGRPYIVGEEGPELFAPNTSGYIVPNDALRTGGGARTEITMHVHPSPGMDENALADLVGRKLGWRLSLEGRR